VINIPNPKTLKHAKQSSLDEKIVLAAGRLVPEKGFDLLLNSWSKVIIHEPNWRLRIVGSGSEEQNLKNISTALNIKNSVDFFPHSKDMVGYFSSASIFACSSRFEGFPLVLIEAKSFGIPIVTFDCGSGPAEIVGDNIDGLLVSNGDCNQLANSILDLIRNKDKLIKFGKNAINDKRYNIDQIIPLWKCILSA